MPRADPAAFKTNAEYNMKLHDRLSFEMRWLCNEFGDGPINKMLREGYNEDYVVQFYKEKYNVQIPGEDAGVCQQVERSTKAPYPISRRTQFLCRLIHRSTYPYS